MARLVHEEESHIRRRKRCNPGRAGLIGQATGEKGNESRPLDPRKMLIHEPRVAVPTRLAQLSPVDVPRRPALATAGALNLDAVVRVEKDDVAPAKCPKRRARK